MMLDFCRRLSQINDDKRFVMSSWNRLCQINDNKKKYFEKNCGRNYNNGSNNKNGDKDKNDENEN